MNAVRLLLLLLMAFLAVFVQAAWELPRRWLGGPISLLPPLVVVAALRLDLAAVAALAFCGGLWQDALSANPLGSSLLPLYLAGWGVWRQREVLLRELDYAQLVLGGAVSLAVPVLTLLVVMTKGARPPLGWHTLWQLVVLTVTGGVVTPVLFRIFARQERFFIHPVVATPVFRPDREIKRGRY